MSRSISCKVVNEEKYFNCEEQIYYLCYFVRCELLKFIYYYYYYLLAIRQCTVYKTMICLYKVRYHTMNFCDVVGCIYSDVTSGALQV